MKKYQRTILFSVVFGLGMLGAIVFAASVQNRVSTTSIRTKTISDKVTHTEFNSLVQTTKGIYRDDNGTPTDYTDDKFGFGKANPSVALDAMGAIKIGVTAATCGAGIEGALRYNTTSNLIELCNGTTWSGMVLTAACSPNCSATGVTCAGVTFADGCGGTCTGTKDCSCTATTWSPPTSDYCSGAGFTQTSNCGTTRAATGTKTSGTCCAATTWGPATSTVCSGSTFTQTSDCGTTRSATGAKTTGSCCTPSGWGPATSTVCSGSSFTQTDSTCGTTRSATGTMTVSCSASRAAAVCTGDTFKYNDTCGLMSCTGTMAGTCSSATAAATCTGVTFADSCGDATCSGTKAPYTCANVPTGGLPLAMNNTDSMLKSLQAAILLPIEAGASCGIWADGCSGTINCGPCLIGYKCNTAGICESTAVACTPESTSSACGGAECGTARNNCGTTVSCGSCYPYQHCDNGSCETTCFIAGTEVEMSDGTMFNIENIKEGQTVRGQDGNTNEVLQTRAYEYEGWMYSINGSDYFVTDSHPFMTKEGWKSFNPNASEQEVGHGVVVGTLEIGDELLLRDGTYQELAAIDRTWKKTKVYNLSVSGEHGFYADEYLVHNNKEL